MEEFTRPTLPELLWGVITRPSSTLRQIVALRLWGWGAIIYAAIAAINAAIGAYGVWTFGGLPAGSRAENLGAGTLFLLSILSSLAFWLALSGFAHLITSALGGRGSFRGILAGLGFAVLPGVFMVPFDFFQTYGGVLGGVVSGLASLGIAIWVIYLSIIAVRENYAVAQGRAAAGCIISGCISVILIGGIVATAVVLLVLATVTELGGIA